ncbi:MAG: hypothetical protein NVS9B3_10910 [Gemmatimonadaceae bacterium]
MRSMRPIVATLAVVAATTGLASALHAQLTDPYPATLYSGTGLIDTPVAWVSPTNGDVWVQTNYKRTPWFEDVSKMSLTRLYEKHIVFDTHWARRFSAGLAVHHNNGDYGFFGQAMLLREEDLPGLPAIAVGIKNVGPYKHEDRLYQAEDVCFTGSGYLKCTHGENSAARTDNTLFAVATKTFVLGSITGPNPAASLGLSVGYGNGVFKEDFDLRERYSKSGTVARGLFFGGRFAFHPTLNSTVHVLAENNGFDYNAGAVLDYRGITVGVYGTELDKGGTRDPNSFYLYNYRKLALSLGYTGNIFDIARGVILRTRVSELTLEQQRLRFEIAARERRIRGLELALNRAQGSEAAGIVRRRAETETQVNAEKEAIRRAEERLRQIQEGQTPTTPQPPQNTPPTPPPAPPKAPPPSTPSGSPLSGESTALSTRS